jgi:hypothetical protein
MADIASAHATFPTTTNAVVAAAAAKESYAFQIDDDNDDNDAEEEAGRIIATKTNISIEQSFTSYLNTSTTSIILQIHSSRREKR